MWLYAKALNIQVMFIFLSNFCTVLANYTAGRSVAFYCKQRRTQLRELHEVEFHILYRLYRYLNFPPVIKWTVLARVHFVLNISQWRHSRIMDQMDHEKRIVNGIVHVDHTVQKYCCRNNVIIALNSVMGYVGSEEIVNVWNVRKIIIC